MKFVYVLEDDPKFQKEIAEALSAIDTRIQSRFFHSLEEFFEWVKTFTKEGKPAITKGGRQHEFVPQQLAFDNDENELGLVVFKVEFLGASQLSLLKKLRKSFIDHQASTAEKPTGFLMTAFDNPDFDIKLFEDAILYNVIMKPFDKLILRQHLTFALEGRTPPTENTLNNQKTTAAVEMLKDIQLEAMSDIGFVSASSREIRVGSVCKYYGRIFTSERHRSVLAICNECVAHPTQPNMFRASFLYFALDQLQISNLRKYARAKDSKEFDHKWAPFSKQFMPECNVIVLDEEESQGNGIIPKMEKMFSGVKVIRYKSFGAFASDVDPTSPYAENVGGPSKAFGGIETVTLHFDQPGRTYLNCTNEGKAVDALFGLPLSDLKNKYDWFSGYMPPEHKEKYRKYVSSGTIADDGVLSINIGEASFQVKVTEAKKDTGRFLITIRELSKEERLEFLKANSKLNKPVHIIVGAHQFFGEGAKEKWKALQEGLKSKFAIEPKIFITSKQEFSDKQEAVFAEYISEIFYKPIDPVYFMQKMKIAYPAMSEKLERIKFTTIESSEHIKTVNQVKVTEISEAGFVMEYYRALTIGSFREIVLWKPNELEAPEILASCNFVKEMEGGEEKKHECHFVFFGSTDAELKHIRLWIMENYVNSKEAQAS